MKTSISKNYIYNASYKAFTLLTPIITAPLLAREIGKEGIGIFSYTYSIAYNFMLLAKLGLIAYGSRCIARVRDDQEKLSHVFTEIYLLQITSTIFASIGYYFYVIFFSIDYKTILLINGLYVLSILFDIDWLFYGIEQFKTISLRNAFIKFLTVVFIVLFVRARYGLMTYVVIMVASDLIRFISVWVCFSKITSFVKVKADEVFKHLKPCAVLFIPVIATSVYRTMDKVMLGTMSTMDETGLYENSEKIIYMLLGFVTSLDMVMMPRITNILKNGDKNSALKAIRNSMVFIVALTSAMAFGVIGITNRFIPFFYGKDFLGCTKLLPPLAITLVFIGWANVIRTQYVMPKGLDRHYVYSTIIGAIVNLIVNFIFIPFLSSMGAVIGTIFAELSVAIYLSTIARKSLPIIIVLKTTFFFPVIGILMSFLVNLIGCHINNIYLCLLLQISFGTSFFLLLSIYYFKFFQPDFYFAIVDLLQNTHRRTLS